MKTILFLLLGMALQAAAPEDPVGTTPPEWAVEEWINSPPLKLSDLRGKVVLVRWWTGPQCSFCTDSAPVLQGWWNGLRERGLVVAGMYHHKASTPLDRAHVEAQVKRLGFTFPVATDPGWRTLRAWWLEGRKRDFTSVSFLIGRDGKIAHVHSGGTIDPADERGKALAAAITAALGK